LSANDGRAGRGSSRPARKARAGDDGAPQPGLLVAERHRQIRHWLAQQGSVRVTDLARRIVVSQETIRRDLRALEAEGVARTVHGGAILRAQADAEPPGVPPVDLRRNVEQRAKNAIAAAAAGYVENGQVVIIDAGTTTLAVAQALRAHRGLTIVTNSLTVAQVAAALREASTYVIGGRLVAGSLSMIGPKARRDLATVRADWAFLGAAAIDVNGGFTSADPYEAEVKRAMIRSARNVAIVADHTKFDSRRFASFADASDIQFMFTTAGIPTAVRRWLERAGAKVVICDTPARFSARRS
jgi:DeoR/GlpR family transcriptional regulator of sugar metabolism